MSQVEKIVKDSAIYSASTVISQLVGVLTSISMRKFLTPEAMGVWTTLMLIVSYSLFTELGVFTAIDIKVPYLRGKNVSPEIQNIRDVAFTFAIAISSVLVIVLFIVSFILSGRIPGYVILGLRMIALIIAATFFYNLYIVMLRADKNFFLLSKAIVVNSLATLLFVASLAYLYGIKGMYLATLFAMVASWAYVKFNSKYTLKLSLNIGLIKSLSSIGLPILIAGIAYTVLLSIDKIMIIKMIGAKELGFYSIAILAMTYTHNFPKLFGVVLFPTMQEEFGRNDSREHVLKYVKQPIFIMAYVFPVLLAFVYFGVPVLVRYVLPKYIPGIDSMKVLLSGCFFISMAPLTSNFIMTVNKQKTLIPIITSIALFCLAINYGAIKMGYGLVGVAVATSITYFLYFAIMYFYVLLHCEKIRSVTKAFLSICIPFAYSLTIVVALEHLAGLQSPLLKATVQATAFFIAYSPMLWYVNRKTMLIQKIFSKKRTNLPGEILPFDIMRAEE